MSMIYNLNPVSSSQTDTLLGALSNPDVGSVNGRLKAINDADTARISTAPTTASVAITSSATAVTLGTAAGRGFAILNNGTTAILIRRGSDPTASLYEMEVPANTIFYDDIRYAGSIRAILKTGSTAATALVTIF